MALTPMRTRVLLGIALLLLVLAGWEGWHLAQIHAWNAVIARGDVTSAGGHAPVEVRFAAAYALAEKGDVQAALNVYRQLEGEDDAQLGLAARYNSANLYLDQALALRSGSEESRALPLIELAKDSYRELLRQDSDDWDARYNLEQALRLAPELEDDDREALDPPPGAERAVTTMRGFTLGLP